MTSFFPCRSALYVPASHPRAMRKAPDLSADFIIVDLEDAVAPAAKGAARAAAAQALRDGAFKNARVVIRVNALATPWGEDDVAACAALPVAGVLVPKVESPDTLTRAGALLAAGGAPPGVALWAMIETPRAVLEAPAIARAGGRLAGLVAGTNDLAAALRAPPASARHALATALSLIVLAARANGLAALDGVYNALADAEGFARECEQGRALGFDGKTLIHPGQIEIANRVFAPTEAERAAAQAIVDAFAAADSETGVLNVNGQMTERLHLEAARRVLAAGRGGPPATGD